MANNDSSEINSDKKNHELFEHNKSKEKIDIFFIHGAWYTDKKCYSSSISNCLD